MNTKRSTAPSSYSKTEKNKFWRKKKKIAQGHLKTAKKTGNGGWVKMLRKRINKYESNIKEGVSIIPFREFFKESPDVILVNKKILDSRSPYAVVFIVMGETVFFAKRLRHDQLLDTIATASRKAKGERDVFLDLLKDNKVYVLGLDDRLLDYNTIKNIDNIFYNQRIQSNYQPITGIISGRFWIYEGGYISMWESPDHVNKQISTIDTFIKSLGFSSENVKWEVIRKVEGGYEDEVFVSYDEYTNAPPEQGTSELRKKQLAAHLIAGMKRSMGIVSPTKQYNPDMSNVEYKNLTTFGDSVEDPTNFD